jgi:hypothetical protein
MVKLKKNNTKVTINGIEVILTNQISLPYSFWNSIFINKQEFENGKISNELLIHEFSHIRQKHSFDILLIEFVQIIFWFNPLIFLYKQAIKLNHEYIADSCVIDSNLALADYQNQLINLISRNSKIFLASNFNYSFTKRRLIMMGRNEKKSIGYKIALIPLLAGLLFYCISCSKETMLIEENNEPWWTSIALKHNIDLHAYNGFNTLVEMGSTNSINEKIVRLENAIFIIKENDKNYIIIRSPLAFHNLITKIIEGEEGTLERYSFNSTSTEPFEKYFMNEFKYQAKE